jgi:hypothetical protein
MKNYDQHNSFWMAAATTTSMATAKLTATNYIFD